MFAKLRDRSRRSIEPWPLTIDGAAELKELEQADLQTLCKEGLAWLAAEANRRFQKSFVDLDEADQLTIVTGVLGDAQGSDAPAAGAAATDPGGRFLPWLKAMTIDGFYTSRTGLDELDYKGNSFYTSPPGCDTFRPK